MCTARASRTFFSCLTTPVLSYSTQQCWIFSKIGYWTVLWLDLRLDAHSSHVQYNNNNNNNNIIIIAEPRPASIECNVQSQVYLHIHSSFVNKSLNSETDHEQTVAGCKVFQCLMVNGKKAILVLIDTHVRYGELVWMSSGDSSVDKVQICCSCM